MKNLSRASIKKEDKIAEGFQILHFHWSFSNDITAVKGLQGSVSRLQIIFFYKLTFLIICDYLAAKENHVNILCCCRRLWTLQLQK